MFGVSGAMARLHGRLALRDVDRLLAVMTAIISGGALLAALHGNHPRGVGLAGCAALGLLGVLVARQSNRLTMWALAAESSDPVAALALFERLYRMPLRDVRAIVAWQVCPVGQPPEAMDALRDLA